MDAVVNMVSEKHINTTLILLQNNASDYIEKIPNNYSQSKLMTWLSTLIYLFQHNLTEKERLFD